jgi:hypothetical protein
MRYEYTTLYQILGLTRSPDEEDLEVYSTTGQHSLRAIFPSHVDAACYNVDRVHAMQSIWLRGIFGGNRPIDLSTPLKEEVADLCKERSERLGSSAVLVLTARGPQELDLTRPLSRHGDAIVGAGIADKDSIRARHKREILGVLTSISLVPGHSLKFKHITDAVYFFNHANELHISITFSVAGDLTVSRPLETADVEFFRASSKGLTEQKQLERVNNLLVEALSESADALRAFVAGWAALEVLVNKIFREYEVAPKRGRLRAFVKKGDT